MTLIRFVKFLLQSQPRITIKQFNYSQVFIIFYTQYNLIQYAYTKLGGVGERRLRGSGLRDFDLERLGRCFLLAGTGDLDLERRLLGGVGDLLY